MDPGNGATTAVGRVTARASLARGESLACRQTGRVGQAALYQPARVQK